jgi:uncharacterized membrane protein YccC
MAEPPRYATFGTGRTTFSPSVRSIDRWASHSEPEDAAVSNKKFSWLPTWDEALFSVKTFLAGMLALYIAFSIDLSRPYWALATVYIVSQPLAGALRSKAVYRIGGTLLGAVVTVALVPNLANSPELLSASLALWVGLCLYLSLLDRTPRSYLFILAGYSTALIGFPAVDEPGAIFDIALARVEEITLGILCATVVGSVVFPRSLGPVLAARLDSWLNDANRWSLEVLAGRRDRTMFANRRRLAADAVELNLLSTHLAFDTSSLQGATRWVRMLEQRMVVLLPLLAAICDRLDALRQADAISPALKALLADVSTWLSSGGEASRSAAIELRGAIARFDRTEPDQGRPDWSRLVLASLLERLREFVAVIEDCRALRRHIASETPRPPARRIIAHARAGAALHRDHGMAMLSALAAVLSIGVCCVIWIATAWTQGALAAQIAAVVCCFFATQDDPVPAIVSFVYAAVTAIVIDLVYLFVVLPRIDGFPMLVLVLAPTFLLIGIGIARPALTGFATGVAIICATLLSLQTSYSADFVSYVNGGLASIAGMSIAAIVTGIIRSVGADLSARRLLRAGWRDIATAAQTGDAADRAALVARMLDRLGLLTPRLAALPPDANAGGADAMLDLRVGVGVIDVRAARFQLSERSHRALDDVLDGIATYYGALAAEFGKPPRTRALLLEQIDRALSTVAEEPASRMMRSALLGLVGVRRALFADAPPTLLGQTEPGSMAA